MEYLKKNVFFTFFCTVAKSTMTRIFQVFYDSEFIHLLHNTIYIDSQ